MAMWSFLVLAVVKQRLGYDFDRLHDTVNQHMTLRQFLDHTDSDKKRYHYQTLVDNVSLLTPELLGKVNQLIVESGHTVVGKSLVSPCAGAVIRLSLKPMFIIPQTLTCCWMRCAVCSAMQGPSAQNLKCRTGGSGCICWKPSRINSTRFGKPDAPDERISRPILNSALNLSAALKHSFWNWPQRGFHSRRLIKSSTSPCTLCGRSTRSVGVFSRARHSHRTKRYSPSLSRTRGGSRKARQVARWNSVFQ